MAVKYEMVLTDEENAVFLAVAAKSGKTPQGIINDTVAYRVKEQIDVWGAEHLKNMVDTMTPTEKVDFIIRKTMTP